MAGSELCVDSHGGRIHVIVLSWISSPASTKESRCVCNAPLVNLGNTIIGVCDGNSTIMAMGKGVCKSPSLVQKGGVLFGVVLDVAVALL